MVDGNGIPLAVRQSGANVHDCKMFETVVDAVRPIRRPVGRPRKRPYKLHADKGYDYPFCRALLRRRGVIPRIARRGIESRDRLGRYRCQERPSMSPEQRVKMSLDQHAKCPPNGGWSWRDGGLLVGGG